MTPTITRSRTLAIARRVKSRIVHADLNTPLMNPNMLFNRCLKRKDEPQKRERKPRPAPAFEDQLLRPVLRRPSSC